MYHLTVHKENSGVDLKQGGESVKFAECAKYTEHPEYPQKHGAIREVLFER